MGNNFIAIFFSCYFTLRSNLVLKEMRNKMCTILNFSPGSFELILQEFDLRAFLT